MRWSAFLWLVSVPGLALAGDCPDFDSLGASAETAAQRLTQAEALYPAIYDNIGEFSELGPWVVEEVRRRKAPSGRVQLRGRRRQMSQGGRSQRHLGSSPQVPVLLEGKASHISLGGLHRPVPQGSLQLFQPQFPAHHCTECSPA